MATVQFLEVVSPLSSVLPLFFFILFLYKWLSTKPSAPGENLPPSPPKLPIIGNLHHVGTRPHRSLLTLSRRYGDLMFLMLGSKPTVVISSTKLASQVIKTFDYAFSGRPNSFVTKHYTYNFKDVAFAPYGEHWRHARSICVLQLLTNKRAMSFHRVRKEELGEMTENIRKSPVVNLSKMFMSLTMNVICKAAFGRKNIGKEINFNFDKFLRDYLAVIGSTNVEDALPWMGWINRLNGYANKVIKNHKVMDEILERIVQEHKGRLKEARDDSVGNETPIDFVDILLQVQKEGNSKGVSFDNETIKAIILDMFLGGTHTGYLTLEWTFTEIMRHPRIMKRLQEEVRGIVGDKEYATEEDLEKMVYLKAVIKESFRIHPPLPLLVPRECIQDVKLNGYDIAVGTQVIINFWAIGRDPTSWKEPENFDPDRFLNSTIDFKGQDFELIPFGAGRRGCPGISFGMAGVEFVLANLIHQFDWVVPNGAESESLDIAEGAGIAPHKEHPLVLAATPRPKY